MSLYSYSRPPDLKSILPIITVCGLAVIHLFYLLACCHDLGSGVDNRSNKQVLLQENVRFLENTWGVVINFKLHPSDFQIKDSHSNIKQLEDNSSRFRFCRLHRKMQLQIYV